jgi:hypothetical protein
VPIHKTYTAIINELLTDPQVTEGHRFGVPVLKINVCEWLQSNERIRWRDNFIALNAN